MVWRGSPSRGRLARALVAAAPLLLAGALAASAAFAELGVAVSVEEGVSVMGGPLRPDMARPDEVTTASVDAITTASRVSHGGGLHVHLSRGGSGTLSLGVEYVHYRFDLDYELGRADVSVVALRVLAAARLALLHFRGAPLLTFGFGGYVELALYDEATLSGSWVNLELAPAAAGLAVEAHLHPFRFALPGDGGHVVPGIYARAYRGLLPQLEDELGSSAPLSSIACGFEIRYELPRRLLGSPEP